MNEFFKSKYLFFLTTSNCFWAQRDCKTILIFQMFVALISAILPCPHLLYRKKTQFEIIQQCTGNGFFFSLMITAETVLRVPVVRLMDRPCSQGIITRRRVLPHFSRPWPPGELGNRREGNQPARPRDNHRSSK